MSVESHNKKHGLVLLCFGFLKFYFLLHHFIIFTKSIGAWQTGSQNEKHSWLPASPLPIGSKPPCSCVSVGIAFFFFKFIYFERERA